MSDHPPADAPPSRSPSAVSLRVAGAGLVYDRVPLFDDLSFDLPAGEWTCLLGPSGVGKTTLLRLFAGLEGGATGTVTCGDGGATVGRISYMGQRDLLLPWLSLIDNVLLGARLRGESLDAPRERALALLDRVGLGAHAGQRPDTCSGGMRQRAALVRTLIENRPIVLMDEPFSAVDAITRLHLHETAAEMLAGRTVLLVTHDPFEGLRLADRVLVMTGRPARIGAEIRPPGAPVRATTDERLLPIQRQILDLLNGGDRG